MVMSKKVKIIWFVAIVTTIAIGSAICWISNSVDGLPSSFNMFLNEKELSKEEIESYYPRP